MGNLFGGGGSAPPPPPPPARPEPTQPPEQDRGATRRRRRARGAQGRGSLILAGELGNLQVGRKTLTGQ